jgi:hypothetical protein
MGWDREDETVGSVFVVDAVGVSAWGFGCGARSREGIAQVEMAKPRPASLWLRIVEWERRKGMFWESGNVVSLTVSKGLRRRFLSLTAVVGDFFCNDVVLESAQAIDVRVVDRLCGLPVLTSLRLQYALQFFLDR